MQTKLNPYLSFPGTALEAAEFYHKVFGGELTSQTFKEGGISKSASDENRIMHAQLITANGNTLMLSDTPFEEDPATESNISLSLSGDNDTELTGYFNKLAEDGVVTLPLVESPWKDKFGMVTDQFGINWMINIAAPQAE